MILDNATTQELVEELMIRFASSNGIEFVSESDLNWLSIQISNHLLDIREVI